MGLIPSQEEKKSFDISTNENETSFDTTFHQLKHNSKALNDHVVNLLETQINGNLKNEIIYYRKVQALYPILSILFNDQTKVEIFIQIQTNSQELIHGVRIIENLDLCHHCFVDKQNVNFDIKSIYLGS